MTQSNEAPSLLGTALLSALFSALFSGIFSHIIVRNSYGRHLHDFDIDRGRPHRLRFEAPPLASGDRARSPLHSDAASSDAGEEGDADAADAAPRRRRRALKAKSQKDNSTGDDDGESPPLPPSGMILACGGRSGFARFVTSEEECHKNEDFFAWEIGGSFFDKLGVDDGGCGVSKSGDVANVTCGEDLVQIFDGEDGAQGPQGPPGEACSINKDEENGTSTVTCGNDSVDIVDGMNGEAGEGCSVSKEDGIAGVTCGEDYVEISDGEAGPAGTGCTISKTDGVATVTCGEDTVNITDGMDGREGQQGQKGNPGAGCSVTKANGVATVNCGEGIVQIADGAAGEAGAGCSVTKTDGVAKIDCGGDPVEVFDGDGEAGPAGAGCTVSKENDITTVTCGDDKAYIADGMNGREGKAGRPGAGCTVTKSNGVATVNCGQATAQVADGAQGPAGKGCSVTKRNNVAKIDCGGELVELYDGKDGKDGATGDNSEIDLTGKTIKLDGVTTTFASEFHSTEPTGAGLPVEVMQPSLGVNFVIRHAEDYAASFVGEIRMYAGNVPPEGWLLCDGAVLSARDVAHLPLSLVVGNAYNGEGVEPGHFAVPDLRGRAPVGAGQVQDAYGSAQEVDLARRYGSFRVALSEDNLPKHRHLLAEVQSIAGTASVAASASSS